MLINNIDLFLALNYQHEYSHGHDEKTRSNSLNNSACPTYINCKICLYLRKIEKQIEQAEKDYYEEMERQHREEELKNEQN